MRLRPDLVLVKLPPARNETRVELISTDLDTFLASKGLAEFQRVVPVPKVDSPGGLVVQVGSDTADVWPGDFVLLEPNAGQLLEIPDPTTGIPHPHVLVSESDITCVLERTA